MEEQLENIKMLNIRKFLVTLSIIWFIADIGMLYPRFLMKKFFPNQIGMVIEALLVYPIYIMLIMSYCKRFKNKKALIKPALIATIVRTQFGFWNLPDAEVGKNEKVRYGTKALSQGLILMMAIQMLSTFTKNYVMLFLLLNFNVLLMYMQIIGFYNQKGGADDDISAYGI